MSDARDILKPVGLQPIGGQPAKKEEAATAPPSATSAPKPSLIGPPSSMAPRMNPEQRPAPPTASAYLQTAAPTPVDPTPLNPADNLRRLQHEDEAADNSPRVRAVFFGVGSALVVFALAGYVFGKLPHAARPVNDYTEFTAKDASFTCETPQGWEQKATGEVAGEQLSAAENGLVLSSGSSRIEISMSTVAGLMKGQLLFGSDIAPGAMTGKGNASAVAGLQKKAIARRYVGYNEKQQKDIDSKMANTEGLKALAKMGDEANVKMDIEPDVRLYEFTASEPWYNLGGKVHGFRGVFGGHAYIASVLCQCPDPEWKALKPVFLHVMESIREVPKEEPKEEEQPQGPTGVFTPPPG